MPYEMQSLLQKCDLDDFRVLAKIVDTYVAATNDKKLTRSIDICEHDPSGEHREVVTLQLEKEIRYLGSSDIAHLSRYLRGSKPAGASVDEIIRDVSAKLKVKQRILGSVEARLERLVKAVVEKTFFKLSADQQRELFNKAGISEKQQRDLFDRLKGHKVVLLPILNLVLGPEVVAKLIQGIVLAVIAQVVGREAAKAMLKQLIMKFPWWAEWIGPIVWGLSIAWLAIDIQGPAYRKTIPALLYLGVVALRDGPEDPDFWETPSDAD